MFERFTDRSRRVIVLAQEEARLLGHSYIGTEHLLLGLIHEGEGGVAAHVLASLGVSLTEVRSRVERMVGPAGPSPSGQVPFTPGAKIVLELSLREALQLGHDYIGTEHVLLGMIREGEGVAGQVLVGLGADLPRVRQRVVELLAGDSELEPPDEAGARTVTLTVTADGVTITVADPDVADLLSQAIALHAKMPARPAVLRGDDPNVDFRRIWDAVRQTAADLLRTSAAHEASADPTSDVDSTAVMPDDDA